MKKYMYMYSYVLDVQLSCSDLWKWVCSCNPCILTCELKVKDNIRDAMIVQLKDEYVSETASDSLSKDWNKMQQDVSIAIVIWLQRHSTNAFSIEDVFVNFSIFKDTAC